MRLFISFEIPDAVKAELEKSASLLRSACTRGTFAPPENYHITLAFLGEVPPERMEDIASAMDSCACRPVPLTIGELGRFRWDGGDVFWRAVRAPDSLARLRQRLTAALAAKGFAVEEEKAFRPHLTLARQAVMREGAGLDDLSMSLPDLPFTAGFMTLMRSQRVGAQLSYTPVYRTQAAIISGLHEGVI